MILCLVFCDYIVVAMWSPLFVVTICGYYLTGFFVVNILFRLFCLAAEDFYNDGTIGSDGSICRTLCDICICLDGSPSCEDSPIAIMQKNKNKNQSTFFYT